MDSSLLLTSMAGLMAGAIHVLSGPDHLAAIGPMAANQPKRSWRIGMWWGLGHTISVWIIAVFAFFLRGMLPSVGMSQWSERLVGVILIALGAWGLQKALRWRLHCHIHEHGGVKHAHFHVHGVETAHDHQTKSSGHQHRHVPMGVGIVHGFGGSMHLIAIIPALALPGRYSAAGFVAGFGIGTIIAMICFSSLLGLLLHRVIDRFTKGYQWMQIAFSVLAIGIGVFWIVNNL